LVSGHKTGYQIAYLRNWLPYFIFATAALAMTVLGDVTVAGSSGEVLTDVDGSSVRDYALQQWLLLQY